MLYLEYKKKLYSFQENAEQMEGFQTQEMAKIKHLVSFNILKFSEFIIVKQNLNFHYFIVTCQRTRP